MCLPLFLAMIGWAQPGSGNGRGSGGGGRPQPGEMAEREKQMLYKQVSDLSEDQKLLIDGIYAEFSKTIIETFEKNRGSGDREAMRTQIQAVRKEKDELLMDVLSATQYQKFDETRKSFIANRRKRGEENTENESPQ